MQQNGLDGPASGLGMPPMMRPPPGFGMPYPTMDNTNGPSMYGVPAPPFMPPFGMFNNNLNNNLNNQIWFINLQCKIQNGHPNAQLNQAASNANAFHAQEFAAIITITGAIEPLQTDHDWDDEDDDDDDRDENKRHPNENVNLNGNNMNNTNNNKNNNNLGIVKKVRIMEMEVLLHHHIHVVYHVELVVVVIVYHIVNHKMNKLQHIWQQLHQWHNHVV